MPITRSAKKKERQDVKRTADNDKVRRRVKDAVKAQRQDPSPEHLRHAMSVLDRAAQKHIIHKNKAGRLKRKLARLVG